MQDKFFCKVYKNSDMGNIFIYQVDFDLLVNAYINNNYKIREIILETLSYDK